jgi:CYTH domain-containing protein
MPSYKYAQIEYERRFLLRQLPSDLQYEQFIQITDVYIPYTRLRLRKMASPSGEILALKLTQKYSHSDLPASQTIITNFYLNEVEFDTLAGLSGRSISKQRYTYYRIGHRWSLDEFQGPLDGLLLAEIEAQSAEELAQIPMLTFAAKEVTADPRFTGGALIQAKAETITALLADV